MKEFIKSWWALAWLSVILFRGTSYPFRMKMARWKSAIGLWFCLIEWFVAHVWFIVCSCTSDCLVAKVETLLKCGYRDVLGFADQNYWDVLCEHFDHTRVNNTDDCIGVQVYGDEATIFDGLSYMCIAWSSENSPLPVWVHARVFWSVSCHCHCTWWVRLQITEKVRSMRRSRQLFVALWNLFTVGLPHPFVDCVVNLWLWRVIGNGWHKRWIWDVTLALTKFVGSALPAKASNLLIRTFLLVLHGGGQDMTHQKYISASHRLRNLVILTWKRLALIGCIVFT